MLKLILVIIILLLLYLYLSKEDKYEYFEEEKEDSLLEKAKNEINTKDWTVYKASKDENKFLLTPLKEKIIINHIDYKDNIYTVFGKNKRDLKINFTQENPYTPSATGTFNGSPVKIKYSKGDPTFSILIDGETPIRGYVSPNSAYSEPWNKIAPLIFKRGGKIISIIDYPGSKETITSQFEITILNMYNKYLPLMFEIYALTTKYVEELKKDD